MIKWCDICGADPEQDCDPNVDHQAVIERVRPINPDYYDTATVENL